MKQLNLKRHDWLVPALILLLAATCRALYLMEYCQLPLAQVAVGADVRGYDTWAREILSGQLLWTKLPLMAPLYPYWLALLYAVTQVNLLWVRAAQLGLDLAALLMVYAAVRLLWGRWPAAVAGVLWALYLPLIYYSAELISESLVVFLFSGVCLLWALVASQQVRHILYVRVLICLGGLGVLLGAAAITQPVSLAAALLLGAYAIGWCWRERGPVTALWGAMLLGFGLLAPILPVTLRNRTVSGELVMIQARSGLDFSLGNQPAATGTPCDQAGRAPVLAGGGRGSERDGLALYRHAAWRFMREQPGRWLALLGRKFLLTWNARELTTDADLPQAQAQTLLMGLPLPRFGWLAPLALAGVWCCRRRPEVYPFMLVALGYSAILTLSVTSGRYRLGMVPALIILAALGLTGLLAAWRARHWRELAGGSVCAAAGLLLAFAPQSPVLMKGEASVAALMGEAYLRLEQYPAAAPWLRQALTLDPDGAGTHRMLGTVLARQLAVDEAMAHFDRATALDPTHVEARVAKVSLWLELGRHDEARAELEEALKIDPEYAGAWYLFGVMAERDGLPDVAASHYGRALYLDPTLVSGYLSLGELLLRQQQPADAQRYLTVALRLDPRNTRVRNALAAVPAAAGGRP